MLPGLATLLSDVMIATFIDTRPLVQGVPSTQAWRSESGHGHDDAVMTAG